MRKRFDPAKWQGALPEAQVTTLGDSIEVALVVEREELFFELRSGVEEPLTCVSGYLGELEELDASAFEYLHSQQHWAYGDDASLWLVIVEEQKLRLCYEQTTVNDEQVIGFVWHQDAWRLTGMDPRFRG